jgi:hypothetical protein
MMDFYRPAPLQRRTLLLAGFMVGLASATLASSSRAQIPGLTRTGNIPSASITPYASFESSTLSGSGNALTASRVPVVQSDGTVVYKDVTVQFSVDSDGKLTLAGPAEVLPSPLLITGGFIAGNYMGPSPLGGGKFFITVSGPSVAHGGATKWSLAATTGAAPCTYPTSATWYVGPLSSSPLAARLQKAGITSTAWSYGIEDSPQSCQPTYGNDWYPGTLIGVSQTGNAITIASFSFIGSSDSNYPIDEIAYTLSP